MNDGYPNRSEEREINLFNAAENGNFQLNDFLYPSEMKKLEKEGFRIFNVKPSKLKGLFRATIDWSRPYPNGIPAVVYSYMIGFIETRPDRHINKFAQSLYVIAYRVNRRK